MPKKQTVEDRLIQFFTAAPLAEAERLLETARSILRARSPKAATPKAPRKSRAKLAAVAGTGA